MSRLYRFNFNCGLRCWLVGWLVVGAVFERTLPVRPGAREGGRGVTRRGLKASIGSAYVRKNGHVEWNEARFEVETLLSLSLSVQLYLAHPVCLANCNNEFEPELKRWRKFNGGWW